MCLGSMVLSEYKCMDLVRENSHFIDQENINQFIKTDKAILTVVWLDGRLE